MVRSEARVHTNRPDHYLRRLYGHFAPRVPAVRARRRAQLVFPVGTCWMAAIGGLLFLTVEARDRTGLLKLEDTLARHLEHIAENDEPTLSGGPAWTASGSS